MGKNNKGGNNNKGNNAPAASGDSSKILDNATAAMKRTVDVMAKDFGTVRTGKASPAMVEGIMVECYGSQTKLKDVAAITAPEPLLLVIQPWDQSLVKTIEKAIMESNLGIAPVSDGRVIRLPIPPLSQERRLALGKQVKTRAEEGRVAVRNIRRDANETAKKAQKASEITEDELKDILDQIQKATDKAIARIDELMADKEKELMAF